MAYVNRIADGLGVGLEDIGKKKMEIDVNALDSHAVYKLMSGAIVPRPIGWISTIDTNGVPNLAPYSFFNAVCRRPPTLLFCSGVSATSSGDKDTLHNCRETGEFVVNIVTEATAEAMNISAESLPPESQ